MKFPCNQKYLAIFLITSISYVLWPSINLAENPKPIPIGSEVLLSNREYLLSIFLLIFGLLVIIIETVLLISVLKTVGGNIESVFVTLTTTLIIIAGLFVVTAGFTTEQVAPVFGLYGAIVGYLLGQQSQKEKSSKTKNQEINDENQK